MVQRERNLNGTVIMRFNGGTASVGLCVQNLGAHSLLTTGFFPAHACEMNESFLSLLAASSPQPDKRRSLHAEEIRIGAGVLHDEGASLVISGMFKGIGQLSFIIACEKA